jgi:hypothetical protein
MSRRRYQFDEAKVRRYIDEGRGAGEGCSYKPWLAIYDLASRGRSHRPWSIKTNRVHHLLSDGEWKCFLFFEADPQVVDIREQFPLDRLQTLRIARDLGYRHPATTDGTPYMMTIDFLITRVLGESIQFEPYTFKYEPDTLSERQNELLEIAAAFFSGNGFTLKLLDQNLFNESFEKNYDSIRACLDLTHRVGYSPGVIRRLSIALLSDLTLTNHDTIASTCKLIASTHRTDANVVFTICKHLIALNVLSADLTVGSDLAAIRMCDLGVRANGSLPW